MKNRNFFLLMGGIILIALLLNSMGVRASDTTKVTTSTIYHDIKHGIDVNSPKIGKVINTIAKDLKVTADQVWNILVKQQKVWSYCFLLLTISALTNWFIFWKRNIFINNPKYDKVKIVNTKLLSQEGRTALEEEQYASYKPKYRDVEEEKLELIPTTTIKWFKYVHLIICLILSIASYVHFADMLTGFLNPEYGAMKTIAEVATSLK